MPAGNNVWTVYAYDASGNASSRAAPVRGSAPQRQAVRGDRRQADPGTGSRLLRYGGKSGVRMVLTFTLSSSVYPAELNLRVLSGTAKVKVSLPSGNGRTTPGSGSPSGGRRRARS